MRTLIRLVFKDPITKVNYTKLGSFSNAFMRPRKSQNAIALECYYRCLQEEKAICVGFYVCNEHEDDIIIKDKDIREILF